MGLQRTAQPRSGFGGMYLCRQRGNLVAALHLQCKFPFGMLHGFMKIANGPDGFTARLNENIPDPQSGGIGRRFRLNERNVASAAGKLSIHHGLQTHNVRPR